MGMEAAGLRGLTRRTAAGARWVGAALHSVVASRLGVALRVLGRVIARCAGVGAWGGCFEAAKFLWAGEICALLP